MKPPYYFSISGCLKRGEEEAARNLTRLIWTNPAASDSWWKFINDNPDDLAGKFVKDRLAPSFGLEEKQMEHECKATVRPYWNTLLQCTSETCHRPMPCPVHPVKMKMKKFVRMLEILCAASPSPFLLRLKKRYRRHDGD